MMRRLIGGMVLLLVMAGPAQAVDSSALQDFDSSQPVEVTARRLEADDVARQVHFIGEVVARQGDVVIYGERMTLYYAEKSRAVERVEAEKDVRIVQGERVATGDKAIFYNTEGRVVLSGSARVHQGDNFVAGDEITLYLNEDRSVVSSEGESRVKAIFTPKQPEGKQP